MPQDKIPTSDKIYIQPYPEGTDGDIEMNNGENYFVHHQRKFVGYSDNSAGLFLYIIVFIAIVVFTMALCRYLLAAV